MPRPPRILLSQSYYHVMTRGNNRHQVFESVEDYQYYLQLIQKYKADHPFDLYHYALMPNHTHFLIRTKTAADFSTFMKKLNLAYFHHYRQTYGWVGHFWQGRFKSQAVGKDSYFIQCGKYIELNPVRAGLVNDPADYPYSSYAYYAAGHSNQLITEDFLYTALAETPSGRLNYYQKLLIEEIIQTTYTRSVWGSPAERYQENRKQRYYLRNK